MPGKHLTRPREIWGASRRCHRSASLRHRAFARARTGNAGSETGAPPPDYPIGGSVKVGRGICAGPIHEWSADSLVRVLPATTPVRADKAVRYLFNVAAGILPAVEPGILPGGIGV